MRFIAALAVTTLCVWHLDARATPGPSRGAPVTGVAGAMDAPRRRMTARPVARTILALYDSEHVRGPRQSTVHTLAEMPLNHLGLVVSYHDVRQGLPPLASLSEIRGVVTWFASDSLPDPRAYLRWLEQVARARLPVVVIGSLGAHSDERGNRTSLDDINRATTMLGWRYETGWNTTTHRAQYVTNDSRFLGFERPLPRVVPPYGRTHAVSPDVHVALRVSVANRPSADADVVIIGPRGAFVAPGFSHFSDRSTGREFRQWYVNPFELFRHAFQTDTLPKPDTTTISGRRVYYSHVDGDGWRNLTQVEPHRTRFVSSARVVLDEILATSGDLPVTVGAIAGDLDPTWSGTPESLATAKAMYALPHVEAGIHTYSHPFDWQFFTTPRRPAEEQAYGSSRDDADGGVDSLQGEHAKARMYDARPFSLDTEIDGAVAFVERLLPPGKRVMALQWSGNTQPFAGAVARARLRGLANINGGDTRFDREFPSAAWVAPLGVRVGPELQVFASNSNENTYTDLWRDRFFGFSFLTRTVRNTGSPRRLKPFNLYYHMYSGERLSSLNAVLANINYARTLPLAPIETSRFSRIVEGFFTTRVETVGEQTWRVLDRGALQTLRFDGASLLAVDFTRSSGVVGQRHELGSLFVSLDETAVAPVVALKPIDSAGSEPRESVPYLIEARWRTYGVGRDPYALRFTAQGYGPGEFSWSWPSSEAVEVRWRSSSRRGELRVAPDRTGVLRFSLPPLTAERVDVEIVAATAKGTAGVR